MRFVMGSSALALGIHWGKKRSIESVKYRVDSMVVKI